MTGTLPAAAGLAVVVALACAPRNPAPAAASDPQARLRLGVRNAHAMAYQRPAGRVVLFGGADQSRVHGDTWTWSAEPRRWSLLDAQGPTPRTFAAMAADDARGTVVLFGGNRVLFGDGAASDTFLGDTWLLRGARWESRGADGPGARAETAMAYDATRGRVVLFGGYRRGPSGAERLGDTWEWDGERWHHAADSGPEPRNGAALAFDPVARRVVLAGGPPRLVPPDTWSWDGTRWSREPGPYPPGRFNAAMVYDDERSALLRFGGWTGTERAGDTWLRLAGHWRAHPVPGPSPRNHTAMAYDIGRRRTLLFGGHDGERVFGDTWEFDGAAWTLLGDRPAERRVDNGH